jgi:hypothetical protein
VADDDPNLEGLRRRDALLLIALATANPNPTRAPTLRRLWKLTRLYAILRFQVVRRARRLEARGFVEPGWSFWSPPAKLPTVTPLGERVAILALAMLELEEFSAG